MPRLNDVVQAWKGRLARLAELELEKAKIEAEKKLAQSWIRAGFSTGDPLLNIAIGVYGTIDESVIRSLETLHTELTLNVGQLILKLQTSKEKVGTHRLMVGRISNPDLLFDQDKNLLAVASELGMVEVTTDKACFNLIRPVEHRQSNLPLNLDLPDLVAYGASQALPSGLELLIGDRAIEDYLDKHAKMILARGGAREHSLWAKIVAPLTPASVFAN
ncbi:MAG: hypothetical protein AAB455_03190 [Patescibacteria group bacterium]